ncbi:MAG: DUF3467 domain-containing protein [Spirochaetes bacterium]|nr:DUF3467 domain-containing protein [Spirochaetota bacterium]
MENKQEIKLKINDKNIMGAYANQITVMHSKYEFVLDFISMFPPEPMVNARIITTPSALKRIYKAIGINIKKYEEKFGEIEDDSDMESPGVIN